MTKVCANFSAVSETQHPRAFAYVMLILPLVFKVVIRKPIQTLPVAILAFRVQFAFVVLMWVLAYIGFVGLLHIDDVVGSSFLQLLHLEL